MKIPKSLASQLPFKSIPKNQKKRKKPSLESRRAVVLEPEERKKISLIHHLNMIKNEKLRKKKEEKKVKLAQFRAELEKKEKQREERIKSQKKLYYQLKGKGNKKRKMGE